METLVDVVPGFIEELLQRPRLTPLVEGPPFAILIIATLQFLIFAFSLWAIFKLWMSVIEFLGQKSTGRARLLAGLLGGAEVAASFKKLKFKAIGAGLGGTVTILGVAVLAMSVLGNHVVTP